ncbi:HD domain-containing protein [Patescibacteria group bacterium]|nr:HD domain-containing protein [Patescibacteria group bacterium]
MTSKNLEEYNLNDFIHYLFNKFDMNDWPLIWQGKAKKALEIVYLALKNKKRDHGIPFVYHPIDVALMIKNELKIKNPKIIIIALLHDVIEQNRIMAEKNILNKLGKSCLRSIWKLTKEHVAFGRVKKIDDDEKYFRKMLKIGDDLFIIKLSDRISNLKELSECGDYNKIKKYIKDLDTFYIPLTIKRSKNNKYIKKLLSILLKERKQFYGNNDF